MSLVPSEVKQVTWCEEDKRRTIGKDGNRYVELKGLNTADDDDDDDVHGDEVDGRRTIVRD